MTNKPLIAGLASIAVIVLWSMPAAADMGGSAASSLLCSSPMTSGRYAFRRLATDNSVRQYNGTTGAFVKAFVARNLLWTN